MDDRQRLEQLIRRGHACIAIRTFEEDYALGLVRDSCSMVNRPMWVWTIVDGLQDGLAPRGVALASTDKPVAGLSHMAELQHHPVCATLDLIPHLQDQRTLRVLRNLIRRFERTGSQLVMIDSQEDLPQVIRDRATPFDISLPDETELEQIVRRTVARVHRESPVEIDLTRSGLKLIIRNLRGLTRRQAERIILDVTLDDRRFDESDINAVLAHKRRALHKSGLLEYVETPVDLTEIGGLRQLKRWLRMRQNALTDKAQEFGIVRPRGVLMLGVQGAGKSLCAKAIATAWHQPLLRMDVGALYDRYVGESERRLREALSQAEMMAPIVLWIDEIEKAFASAASRSTDGGLSQRMFGTLLTWMQEHEAAVFLVSTANDIEALPPELLRKGRFDEIFFVDLPKKSTRRQIFDIHLRKRKRDPGKYDLDALTDASEGYSGAEIEQAVVAALHEAYAAKREVTTEHILESIRNSPPLSVTMAERVDALRRWARDRCVPAD
jgi:AAA+ superfamily predicted ATPase